MAYRPDPEGAEVEVLRAGANFDGARVLEIGSGQGRLSFRYAGLTALTVGSDPNREYLVTTAEECPAELHSKIALLQSSGEVLPFPDRSFDIALFGWSLWCIPHAGMVHALREAARVLTPAGRLLDLRPIGEMAPIVIMRDGVGRKVHEIDGSPGITDDVASDEAVEQLVAEGLLVETSRQEFLFPHHWDSVDEMYEQIADEWGSRNVIPTSEELDPARAAFAEAGPGASVRVSRTMRQCGYRVNR